MSIDIDKDLVFCSDSILRVKSNYKNKDVFHPLLDIQSFLKEDENFILKLLDNNIHIEKNTTLSSIILSLEPWIKIVSNLTGRNIENYCKACRSLTTKEQLFDFLEISKISTISREYDYEKIKEGRTLKEKLNSKRNPTNNFKTENIISMVGFNIGDNNNYSTTVAFNQIKNTPVFLTKKQSNYIYLSGLENLEINGFKQDKGNILFNSSTNFSLIDFLKGIFQNGLFYENPITDEGYESFNEMLSDSLKSIEKLKKESNNQNVISLFGEKIKEEEEGEKITIAPHAFDNLVEYFNEKNNFWDNIFENIASESNIKTGKLELSLRDNCYIFEKFNSSEEEK